MRLVVVLLVLLVSTRARAEDKDPALAVVVSLGVSTIGVVAVGASDNGIVKLVGAGALLVGPSTGRWYAGEDSTSGILVRGASSVATIVGVAMVVGASEGDCIPNDTSCSAQESRRTVGTVLAISGVGVFLGSSIVDVVLAERAAVHANEHHVTVTPALVGTNPGLVLAGRF